MAYTNPYGGTAYRQPANPMLPPSTGYLGGGGDFSKPSYGPVAGGNYGDNPFGGGNPGGLRNMGSPGGLGTISSNPSFSPHQLPSMSNGGAIPTHSYNNVLTPTSSGGGGDGVPYGTPTTPSTSYAPDGTPISSTGGNYGDGWGGGTGEPRGWAGAAGPLAGLIGGIIGGKGSDFGAGQTANNVQSGAADVRSLGATERGLGGTQFDYLNSDQAAQRAAVARQAEFLQQDPATDQQRTADMAKMQAGTAGAYQRARAMLAQGGAAASGGSAGVGSGPSSTVSGGANYLANQAGGAAAAAQAQEFNNIQADRERRMNALTQLYGGQVGQDYGQGMGLYGAAGNNFQNYTQDEMQMYAQQLAAAKAQAGGLGSMMGTAGNIAGMFV